MAKKGQPAQLQVEVNNDEDWEKLLTREGLIIADVYSEWCGPCAAMVACLRKLKLEIGGDFMHLALAKSDGITALRRFKNKSEPTWMFLANGQMVQLIFGANAPILQQVIIDELKKEKQCIEGLRTRVGKSPDELSESEQAEVDAFVEKEEIKQKILEEKLLKQEREHKLAQAKNILTTYAPTGLIVVFPHAYYRAGDVVEKTLGEAGLSVSKREKPIFTEEMLNDIEYFANFKIPEDSRPFLLSGERCMAYTINLLEGTPGPVDDAVLSFVYGPSKCPPGDPNTPAQLLIKSRKPAPALSTIQEVVPEPQPTEGAEEGEDEDEEGEGEGEEEGEEEGEGQGEEIPMPEIIDIPIFLEEGVLVEGTEYLESESQHEVEEEELEDIMGVWAPSNELVKATALRYVMANIMQQFILPEPEAPPPHVAVAFDAFKRDEVMKLVNEFQNDVMAYGFFTDQNPDVAKLIAKTPRLFEKTSATTTYGEKFILKVSKKRSDPLLAFAQLGPTYISGNVNDGEAECAIFFPEDYNSDEEEAPKVEEKKPKKGKARLSDQPEAPPEEIVFEEGVIGELPEGPGEGEGESEIGGAAGEMTELPPVEGEEAPGGLQEPAGEDRATSPMDA